MAPRHCRDGHIPARRQTRGLYHRGEVRRRWRHDAKDDLRGVVGFPPLRPDASASTMWLSNTLARLLRPQRLFRKNNIAPSFGDRKPTQAAGMTRWGYAPRRPTSPQYDVKLDIGAKRSQGGGVQNAKGLAAQLSGRLRLLRNLYRFSVRSPFGLCGKSWSRWVRADATSGMADGMAASKST